MILPYRIAAFTSAGEISRANIREKACWVKITVWQFMSCAFILHDGVISVYRWEKTLKVSKTFRV